MGGRLDTVNMVDADASIIVSVGLDHMEWLGTDIESVGREKAGIMRRGRPAIVGTATPPRSVLEVADRSARNCCFVAAISMASSGPAAHGVTMTPQATSTFCRYRRSPGSCRSATRQPRWQRCGPCADDSRCRGSRWRTGSGACGYPGGSSALPTRADSNGCSTSRTTLMPRGRWPPTWRYTRWRGVRSPSAACSATRT